MQLGWSLPLFLDAHCERALESLSGVDDGLGNLALEDPLLRRVPHLELTARDFRGGDNFEIGDRHEVPDFQLALAHDGQGRRLHPADPDHPPRALSQDDGRGAGERQVVDLVGLPARDGGGVEPGVFGVWLRPTECVADGLRVLRGEQHPHHLAAVLVMLENLLTDELTLAVAIGGEPDPLGGAQRLANGFELGRLVAALCRSSAVKTFGPQQDRRPALPLRHDILRLEQIEQMALGREDVPVTRTDGGADVFRLAGFLRDDDLISHDGSFGRLHRRRAVRTYSEQGKLASSLFHLLLSVKDVRIAAARDCR